MNLQLFAGTETPETVSGKKLVYLFRVAEDSENENAGALAFGIAGSGRIAGNGHIATLCGDAVPAEVIA